MGIWKRLALGETGRYIGSLTSHHSQPRYTREPGPVICTALKIPVVCGLRVEGLLECSTVNPS